MAVNLLRCEKCLAYNISEKCSECGGRAVLCKPPKYSIEDRYAKYRRLAKVESSVN